MLRKDIDNLNFELAKLREERTRDQEEADRLRDLNCFKERENAEADSRIKANDYDLFKAQERAAELSKLAECRDCELRRTCEQYDASAADLLRARDEHHRLGEDQGQLSRGLDLKMHEKSELVARSEAELGRNRALTGNLHDLEAKHRNHEENLTVTRREQDELRFSN